MSDLRLMVVVLAVLASVARGSDQGIPLEFHSVEKIGPNATTVQVPDGLPAIEVTGGTGPHLFQLIDWDSKAVTSDHYVVRGRVKYESVAGDGYLELWNDFGENGQYFSRTLGDVGPMRKLTGTSHWREFELPFYHGGGKTPKKLTLNIMLPGAGTVTLEQPRVFNLPPMNAAWWTPQALGWIGGTLGAAIGVLGAIMGVTASLPQTRWLSIWFCGLGIFVGAVGLAVGLVAIGARQPWHVYYPLLLIGGICLTVFGVNLRGVVLRSRADELRRLTAIDAI